MDFRLEVTQQDGWTVVGVTGEVDVATGLGVLIGALKRVRSHDGALHLVVDDPRVRKLFDITGLDQVFDIHPSLVDALGS